MDRELLVNLITQVKADLSNQIAASEERLSNRIASLEESKKVKSSFYKTVAIAAITGIIGASGTYIKQHVNISWSHVAEVK